MPQYFKFFKILKSRRKERRFIPPKEVFNGSNVVLDVDDLNVNFTFDETLWPVVDTPKCINNFFATGALVTPEESVKHTTNRVKCSTRRLKKHAKSAVVPSNRKIKEDVSDPANNLRLETKISHAITRERAVETSDEYIVEEVDHEAYNSDDEFQMVTAFSALGIILMAMFSNFIARVEKHDEVDEAEDVESEDEEREGSSWQCTDPKEEITARPRGSTNIYSFILKSFKRLHEIEDIVLDVDDWLDLQTKCPSINAMPKVEIERICFKFQDIFFYTDVEIDVLVVNSETETEFGRGLWPRDYFKRIVNKMKMLLGFEEQGEVYYDTILDDEFFDCWEKEPKIEFCSIQ